MDFNFERSISFMTNHCYESVILPIHNKLNTDCIMQIYKVR